MNDNKIVKLVFEYQEGQNINAAVFENNEYGIDSLNVPDFPENADVNFFLGSGDSYNCKFSDFKKITDNDITPDLEEKLPFMFDSGELRSEFLNFEIQADKPAPVIAYSDNTEKYMLDFNAIRQDLIEDSGLWTYHGLRRIMLTVSNLKKRTTLRTDYDFKFCKFNDEDIPDPIIVENVMQLLDDENETESQTFAALVDTNLIGEAVDKMFPDKSHVICKGVFSITFTYTDESCEKETYQFPINLCFNNVTCYINESHGIIDTNYVSIDFGTSSTCVAVQTTKKSELIAISGFKFDHDSTENFYENPTNIMIYRWEKLFEQWNRNNPDYPLMKKHISITDEDDEFDYGYSVKEIMKDADKRTLNAIISELKLIPYNMAKNIRNKEVFPFYITNSGRSMVDLISSDDNETDGKFDPIAFYGYILGRAINDPANEKAKIHTRYQITYPVKFDQAIREQILNSLSYGLKRSLPRPLRDAVNKKGKPLFEVSMEYPEPVAYLGSICGTELLLDDVNAKTFAVFDFGGGTLDFSFGMYRAGDEDNDDDEGYDQVLDIFGIDGSENIGGERLISKLSYWIFTADNNRENIIKNRIVFSKPVDEDTPESFGPLINDSVNAMANMRNLNEYVSRIIFEGKPFNVNGKFIDPRDPKEVSVCVVQISLIDHNGNSVDTNLNVDIAAINERLMNEMEHAVEAFENAMDVAFDKPEVEEKLREYGISYDKSRINIFMGGNSSKHPFVQAAMKKAFGEPQVHIVNSSSENSAGGKYDITPKSAVALGQLNLSYIKVNSLTTASPPFAWYIEKRTVGGFERLIDKNSTDKSWKKLGVIRGKAEFMRCSSADTDNDNSWIPDFIEFDEEDSKKICYIRPYLDTYLQYIAVPRDEKPNENPEAYEDSAVIYKLK